MQKLFKGLFLAGIILPIFFFSSAPFSGCQKTTDTVTVYKHDTIPVVDTVYDIASGLVGYYNFNGGSLHDSSGYKNDIVFSIATPTADRFGNAGNAYLFDGSTSYMKVHNSASLNPDNITLYAIVKINGFYAGKCSGNQIFCKGSSDDMNGLYFLRFSDSTNGCTLNPPHPESEVAYGTYGDNIPSETTLSVGNNSSAVQTGIWYKFAYTYDGLTAKFYVNGILKGSVTKGVAFTDNSNDIFIGRDESVLYPYWFNGVIDEIRIYNRALTQPAITQLVAENK